MRTSEDTDRPSTTATCGVSLGEAASGMPGDLLYGKPRTFALGSQHYCIPALDIKSASLQSA
ncbi:uncharacterized protein N7479_009408 [Penicillium vulpinum]|uniref:uncharacterized protein n=1 Tax=Penicillium vulpinum TaxID=29845 RepID=UPI002546F738|nr:uncharacterized protein N7479_009408 [Penicillium vulpinum]KAJ5950995.1 hypothetical protein N7479_009408 [Penicillium vulpinum]